MMFTSLTRNLVMSNPPVMAIRKARIRLKTVRFIMYAVLAKMPEKQHGTESYIRHIYSATQLINASEIRKKIRCLRNVR